MWGKAANGAGTATPTYESVEVLGDSLFSVCLESAYVLAISLIEGQVRNLCHVVCNSFAISLFVGHGVHVMLSTSVRLWMHCSLAYQLMEVLAKGTFEGRMVKLFQF